MIASARHDARLVRAGGRVLALLFAVCLAACGSAQGDKRVQPAAGNAAKPVVYVSDFVVEKVDTGSGLLPALAQRHRLLGNLLPGAAKDAATLSRHVVDLMATSLVERIGDAGMVAVRLAPGSPLPAQGVRGVFTEIDQGNRMQRTLMAGQNLDRNVKQAPKEIAETIVARLPK
jgi:hypothetical protein